MRIFRYMPAALKIASVLTLCAHSAFNALPNIDKTKLEAYLRYAEGFQSNVHFKFDDPVASGYPDFYRLAVHLTTDDGAKLDRVYFITLDGQQIVNGSIWDLSKSPFAETLGHLPSTGYSFGPADAKVQLVIFSDFQCPYCKEFAKTIRDNIPKNYPKDVRVTFVDFPLEKIHPWARAAAEASHCIGDQNAGAFWAFHDWIFAGATEIKPDNLKDKILAWAKDQNLNTAKLQTCMDTHADAPAVELAELAGKTLQIDQTPTAFANGRLIPGALPWANLQSVIELELKRPSNFSTPVVSR